MGSRAFADLLVPRTGALGLGSSSFFFPGGLVAIQQGSMALNKPGTRERYSLSAEQALQLWDYTLASGPCATP